MSEDGVLRVLAIDDDSVSLTVLSRILQQCGYRVTALSKATEALDLLTTKRDDFDIVLTDIVMPDMDGFQLLETIHFEIDVPVIMVSSESDPKMIVKGMKSGAQDYFVKPVQMEDVKKLPEYVMKRSENSHEDEHSEKYETESDQSDTNKRKYRKIHKRIHWTPELHYKFMKAVEQIEMVDSSKVIPTKILEIMKEPSLTRENVASHLQKFRKGIKKRKRSIPNESISNVTAAISSSSTPDHGCATASNSIGQYNRLSGSGMMTSSNQIFTKTGSFYPTNQSPSLLPPSNTTPQNYFHYLQMHPGTISTPMLGNASTPMLESVLRASKLIPERKGLWCTNTWQEPYIPRYEPEFESYAAESPAFTSSYPMQHRSVPTQVVVNSQFASQHHCPLTGQHDLQNVSSTVKSSLNLIGQNLKMNDFCGKEQAKVNEHVGENLKRLDHQYSAELTDEIAALLS